MFSIKDEKRYIKIVIGITSLVFFTLCMYSIFKYMNTTLLGNLYSPDNDDVKFVRSGWILAETGKYIFHFTDQATVFMMPGLPCVLAFCVKLFGQYGGITAYRILQAITQTGSLYLIFLISRKLFNSKVGIAAMIISALSIAEYWVANLILTEGMFKFLVLFLVYFTIYAIEEKKMKYYVLGGVFLGLATLFRPAIATFPIVVLVMWIIKKYKFKEMVKYTVIVMGVFCIIMSPWWIRNYIQFDKFIPLTMATGNPMLQGTYINYDQSVKAADGLDYSKIQYPLVPSEMGNNQTEMDISKFRFKNAILKDPIKYISWYTVGKTKCQVSEPFFWRDSFLGVTKSMASTWHIITWVFCIIGIVSFYFDKERNKMANILVGTIIYFVIAYLPFYAMSRYFYPAMPYVIIFAAYAVVKLIDTRVNGEKVIKDKAKRSPA